MASICELPAVAQLLKKNSLIFKAGVLVVVHWPPVTRGVDSSWAEAMAATIRRVAQSVMTFFIVYVCFILLRPLCSGCAAVVILRTCYKMQKYYFFSNYDVFLWGLLQIAVHRVIVKNTNYHVMTIN